jgi:hypothetical protein
LREVVNELVVVIENGRRRKITKLHAAMLSLANKAVSGDRRLMPLLLNELHLMEERTEAASKRTPPAWTQPTQMNRPEYARQVLAILKESGALGTADAEAEPDQVEAKRGEDEDDKDHS